MKNDERKKIKRGGKMMGKVLLKFLEAFKEIDKVKKISEILEIEMDDPKVQRWIEITKKINDKIVEKYGNIPDYVERAKKFYEDINSGMKIEFKKTTESKDPETTEPKDPINKHKILDPFSLYNFIYSHGSEKRVEFLKTVGKILEIGDTINDIDIPEKKVIPRFPAQKRYLFHSDKKEEVEERIKLLWEWFEKCQKIQNNRDAEKEFKNVFEDIIKKKYKDIGIPYFAQTLFVCRPDIFIPWLTDLEKELKETFGIELKITPEFYFKLLESVFSWKKENFMYPNVWFSGFLYEFKTKDEVKQKVKEILFSNDVYLLKVNKQLIFYGPPGTGKTYNAKEISKGILSTDNIDNDYRFKLLVFHPAFEYEQFIRGLRPFPKNGGIEFKPVEGHFLIMCWRALFMSYLDLKKNKEKNCNHKNLDIETIVEHTECLAKENKVCILVIDEINRGNVPLLLGELIYGIEKDKRGTGIDLPYEMPEECKGILDDMEGKEDEKNEFWGIFTEKPYRVYIPHNLYIIGTINTSDRSIGVIDAAIRRRFAFKYMGPDPEVIDEKSESSKKGELKEVLTKLNNLFRKDKESEIRVGGVGHSYFLGDDNEIANQIQYFVIPLLREYVELGIAGENTEKLNEIIEKWEERKEDDVIDRFIKAVNAVLEDKSKNKEERQVGEESKGEENK